jgi:nicotinate-nucleotide--dimethylbenzimidazole phosphoribosyltransferase
MTMTVPGPALDAGAMEAARARWASRAKPPGALGTLEDLAVHLAGVTGSCPPPVPRRPAIALFAGDHGVVADGASAWPSEITGAMVATIASGGAAINAFARAIGAEVTVVDVGVAGPHPTGTGVLDCRVRAGTASIVREPAMTEPEAWAALDAGRQVAGDLIGGGADCLIGGEMGIGNTTPSAAIIAACTGTDPAGLVGPGAGEPAAGMEAKRRLVTTAVERYQSRVRSGAGTGAGAGAGPGGGAGGFGVEPIMVLAELGGLEIGALAGFYLAAAEARVPFIVDGVIAAAALCVAESLTPGTASLAIAGHRSSEPAASVALDHLQLRPLLDLDLRLGEGTGAALAFPLLAAAVGALTDMTDLPEA